MLKRELYLHRIRPYYESDQIKVLTGVRRCGKSTLLQQIIQEISEHVDAGHIIYINIEDFSYYKYYSNPKEFHLCIKQRMADSKKYYIFIDEIQHIDNFELVVASLQATTNCSLFITGSNSTLLAGKLATRLTGRTKEYLIMPFTYKEMLDYFAQESRELPANPLADYLLYGGIPIRFQNKSIRDTLDDLSAIYQSIIQKDIFPNIQDTYKTTFINFSTYTMSMSGTLISPKSLAGYISYYDTKISRPTIYSYLENLCNAYLVQKVDRFDIRGKKALVYLQKFYAIDPGFITINRNGGTNDGLGGVLETVIYNELIARGYMVFIGKLPKGEIDFIVQHGQERCYIQVANFMEQQETRNREFGAFDSVRDNFPKYVLSRDLEDYSHDGIIHLNVEKFLCGNVLSETSPSL